MSIKKKKLLIKLLFLSCLSLFNTFAPMSLSSCYKKSDVPLRDEQWSGKSFFDDVIHNTSYHFSFNKDFSTQWSFNLKNNYSIELKCQKNEIEEFQKQQKIFLKLEFLAKFYLEKVGLIFCLPLITKIDDNKLIDDKTKNFQKDLFKYCLIDDTNSKNNDDEIKEIIIEFSKKKLEEINGKNFNVGQKKYEIIFIVSIFSKSLSFKNIEELEEQKNNIGAKNVNIFLRLNLEKMIMNNL